MFLAAENGHVEAAMELLKLGASKDISDELTVSKEISQCGSPRTPQFVALENGHIELAQKIESFVLDSESLERCSSRASSRLFNREDDYGPGPAKRIKKSPKTTVCLFLYSKSA